MSSDDITTENWCCAVTKYDIIAEVRGVNKSVSQKEKPEKVKGVCSSKAER